MLLGNIFDQRVIPQCPNTTIHSQTIFHHPAVPRRHAPITRVRQGLTLVLFSAQRKHFMWDTLGTCNRYMGHNSSQSGRRTAH
jgi:hypothetical protein